MSTNCCSILSILYCVRRTSVQAQCRKRWQQRANSYMYMYVCKLVFDFSAHTHTHVHAHAHMNAPLDQVEVVVLDVNDNAPIFPEGERNFSISLPETQPLDQVIQEFTASDADAR